MTLITSDPRVLQRADTVLWSLSLDGIVLHNFSDHRFLSLDRCGYALWGLLDGARTVDEAVTRSIDVAAAGPDHVLDLRRLVDVMLSFGFLEER